MKVTLKELTSITAENGDDRAAQLKDVLERHIEQWENEFVQDLSHISDAAVYAGNIGIDQVIHLGDNRYRCDYAYDWQIAWTCSGTQEEGRVQEKVRFVVQEHDQIEFKFLKLEL